MNFDEYMQKVQDIYAILDIEDSESLTIEEAAEEYKKSFQLSQKKNFDDFSFYTNR